MPGVYDRGGVFLRSSLVDSVHPKAPHWLLRDCDNNNDVVVAAAVLPEEALAEAKERIGYGSGYMRYRTATTRGSQERSGLEYSR